LLARESELGAFGIGVFDERQKTEAERLEGLRAERQRIYALKVPAGEGERLRREVTDFSLRHERWLRI
jgi:hypothetical protein